MASTQDKLDRALTLAQMAIELIEECKEEVHQEEERRKEDQEQQANPVATTVEGSRTLEERLQGELEDSSWRPDSFPRSRSSWPDKMNPFQG